MIELKKCYCKDCNIEIYKGSIYCSNCIKNNVVRKFNLDKDELEKLIMIEKMSLVKIGKQFGVSDTTVRKACIRMGINFKNT